MRLSQVSNGSALPDLLQNIGIIGGTGVLGSRFSIALKNIGKTVRAHGSKDIDREAELVAASDLIIVCVPMHVSHDVFLRILPHFSSNAEDSKNKVLVDFNSVKRPIVEKLKMFPCEVISCHPLFGKVESLVGQNILNIPVLPGKHASELTELWENLGLKVSEIETVEKHDEMMGTIQGLMHFLHICFVRTLRKENTDIEKLLKICSPVYRAYFAFSSRIMAKDEHLYTGILMDNPTNLKVIEDFLGCSEELVAMLKEGNDQDFRDGFLANRKFLGETGEKLSLESDFLVSQMNDYIRQNK